MSELEEQNINAELTSNGMRCRMYEQRFPEVDDLVMVQVRLMGAMFASLMVFMTSTCFSGSLDCRDGCICVALGV